MYTQQNKGIKNPEAKFFKASIIFLLKNVSKTLFLLLRFRVLVDRQNEKRL